VLKFRRKQRRLDGTRVQQHERRSGGFEHAQEDLAGVVEMAAFDEADAQLEGNLGV